MTVPNSPALALRGLEKTYRVGLGRGRREVLGGVDLKLERGTTLGLVGPNGSGKSTLLRISSGIERADAGEVRIFGAPPDDVEARRRIGFLPEASPFPGELTAAQALDLLGSLQGMGAAERRARCAEFLERVGLAADAKRYLGRFSKGMLRRFGLAQAFLHAPDLVLLDEPTAGLDAEGFVVLDALLAQARERGCAVLFCSHLLSDIRSHCDRIAILLQGRIAAEGESSELASDRDRVRLELTGVDESALDELEAFVKRAGGEVVSRGPVPARLLEIYRRFGGQVGDVAQP